MEELLEFMQTLYIIFKKKVSFSQRNKSLSHSGRSSDRYTILRNLFERDLFLNSKDEGGVFGTS